MDRSDHPGSEHDGCRRHVGRWSHHAFGRDVGQPAVGFVGSTYRYGYDEIVASAGATGNFTGSIPEATAWGAILVSLNASLPTPVLTQEGFRWRNDDGSETTATWLAAQDTNP